MVVKKKKFLCTIDEWYLARLYSQFDFGEGDRISCYKRSNKSLNIGFIGVMGGVLGLPFAAVKQLPSFVFVILTIVIILSTISVLYFYRKKININWEFFKPPKSEVKMITLYETTKEGLYFNLYNLKDKKVFIPWNQVERIRLGNMEREILISQTGRTLGPDYRAMYAMLKRDIKLIKKYFPDFSYIDSDLEDDIKISLLFYGHLGRVNHLPIPPTWEENGTFIRLVEEIQKHARYTNIDLNTPVERTKKQLG